MININMGNLRDKPLYDIMKRSTYTFCNVNMPKKHICSNCSLQLDCENCIAFGLTNKDSVENCAWFEIQREIFENIIKEDD